MNLTRVLAFHRVAVAGSFTRAAEAAGVSQPTLSSQVRALEQELGERLLERGGRRLRLTTRGRALLAATVPLAEAIEAVEAVLAGARQETRGRLRVSADSAVHVLPILARLKRGSPRFRFAIRIDNSAAIEAQVLGDEADVGVMARRSPDPRLHAELVRLDRLVAMLPAGDPLARHGRVRLADLAGREIVSREKGSITREAADACFGAAGVAPSLVLEVATREAVREAVAEGFGAGLVFASEAGDDPRLTILPIADADTRVAEYAVCLAERRTLGAVARFLETAREVAAERGWLSEGQPQAPLRAARK